MVSMDVTTCTYCKEEIKVGARICKHCRSTLVSSFEEMATAAVLRRVSAAPGLAVGSGAVSPCKAGCYHKFGGDKVALNECLDNCEAVAYLEIAAEKLFRELTFTMVDIIWGGGDIDPEPFEHAVRERFSYPPDA
jgi:hypothetical protein